MPKSSPVYTLFAILTRGFVTLNLKISSNFTHKRDVAKIDLAAYCDAFETMLE
jgi:hypothetical protein